MNGIINMIMRIVIQKGLSAVINKGMAYFYRDKNVDDKSPEAQANRENSKKSAQKTRRGIKMLRRIGRF